MGSDVLHVDVESDAHERINFIKQQNLTNFLVDHSIQNASSFLFTLILLRLATTSASFSRNMTCILHKQRGKTSDWSIFAEKPPMINQ